MHYIIAIVSSVDRQYIFTLKIKQTSKDLAENSKTPQIRNISPKFNIWGIDIRHPIISSARNLFGSVRFFHEKILTSTKMIRNGLEIQIMKSCVWPCEWQKNELRLYSSTEKYNSTGSVGREGGRVINDITAHASNIKSC